MDLGTYLNIPWRVEETEEDENEAEEGYISIEKKQDRCTREPCVPYDL